MLLQSLPLREKITYKFPAKEISAEGIRAVNNYLHQNFEVMLPSDFDMAWLVKSGKLAGTFPRRVQKYLYETHKLKLDAQATANVGNYASNHTVDVTTFIFDFDNELNWRQGDFGDGDSCFWGGRNEARNMLRKNHSLAMRFWNERTSKGEGRAWLGNIDAARFYNTAGQEIDRQAYLEQTLVVFNAYPDRMRGTLVVARVLAGYMGQSYHKIKLDNNRRHDGVLWINNDGHGYLIGPVELIDKVALVDLRYKDSTPVNCSVCQNRVADIDDLVVVDDYQICQTCLRTRTHECGHCQVRHMDVHMVPVLMAADGTEAQWCITCREAFATFCAAGHRISRAVTLHRVGGEDFCDHCVHVYPEFRQCDHCELWNRTNVLLPVADSEGQGLGYHNVCQSCMTVAVRAGTAEEPAWE